MAVLITTRGERIEESAAKIVLYRRTVGLKEDLERFPWQVRAEFEGRDYNAIGATPGRAMAELGAYWAAQERKLEEKAKS